MGQYHTLVNLDKMEEVNPHALGFGAKQWEHVDRGGLDTALYVLVMSSPNRGGGDLPYVEKVSGRWVGDRVVVLGDYTEDNDIPNAPMPASKLYSSDKFTNISDLVAEALVPIRNYLNS